MKDALTSLNRSRNETKTKLLSLRGTELEKTFPDDIGKDDFIAINASSRSLWKNGA